jgi:ParB/RepB/Spo0J family partition protein
MPKNARRSTANPLLSLVASASAEAAGAEELASRSSRAPTQAVPPTVTLRQLRVRPGHNPRKRFDEQALRELADSIEAGGIVQPIAVEPDSPSGGYSIIQGERRYRALRLLLEEDRISEDYPVPVYVRSDLDAEAALTAALVENLQREDLSPLEEAEAFAKLRDLFGRSTAEIARGIGRSRRYVQGRLQLLSLVDEVRQAVLEGDMPAAIARVLTGAPAELQRSALEHFLDAPPPLRTEEAVRRYLRVRLVPFDRALFDPKLYEAEHGGPIWVTDTGERDPGDRGRYFADPELFLRLQREALDQRREELQDRYEWVEELEAWALPEHLEEAPDGPGAVILVGNGLYDVKVVEGVRAAAPPGDETPAPRRPVRADSGSSVIEDLAEAPTATRLRRAARLRTRALQEALASDPVAALRAALVSLLTAGPSVGLRLDPGALGHRPDPPPTVARGLEALARAAGLEAAELLRPDRSRELGESDLYHRLLSVPRNVLVRMFTALVAATLDGGSATGDEPTVESPDLAFELAHDLEVTVTDWRPTAKHFAEYSVGELAAIADRLGVEVSASADKAEIIQVLLASKRIGEYSPPELAFRPAEPGQAG